MAEIETQKHSTELSSMEAKEVLNKAVKEIEFNRIEPPSRFYHWNNHWGVALLLNLVSLGGSLSALFCSLVYNSIILGAISASLAGFFTLFSTLEHYNGNPKNKLRSFLANIFSTNKKRKALHKRQAEYRRYYEASEIFKAYITAKNQQLTEQGIFDSLNTNDTKYHHYLDESGKYCQTKVVSNETFAQRNDQRVNNMVKSLVEYPALVEKLKLEMKE